MKHLATKGAREVAGAVFIHLSYAQPLPCPSPGESQRLHGSDLNYCPSLPWCLQLRPSLLSAAKRAGPTRPQVGHWAPPLSHVNSSSALKSQLCLSQESFPNPWLDWVPLCRPPWLPVPALAEYSALHFVTPECSAPGRVPSTPQAPDAYFLTVKWINK